PWGTSKRDIIVALRKRRDEGQEMLSVGYCTWRSGDNRGKKASHFDRHSNDFDEGPAKLVDAVQKAEVSSGHDTFSASVPLLERHLAPCLSGPFPSPLTTTSLRKQQRRVV